MSSGNEAAPSAHKRKRAQDNEAAVETEGDSDVRPVKRSRTSTSAMQTSAAAPQPASSRPSAGAEPQRSRANMTATVELSSSQPSEGASARAAKRTASNTQPAPEQPAGSAAPQASAPADAFESVLTCSICQEILYKSVACVPCLHAFCGFCLSQWQASASDCPMCRARVTDVRRNHAVEAIVEAYLAANPARRRDAAELARMDAGTKFTAESLRARAAARHGGGGGGVVYDEYDYEYEYEYENDGSGGASSSAARALARAVGALAQAQQAANLAASSASRLSHLCRYCVAAAPDGFRCSASAPVHISCSVCLEPLPDFRAVAGRPAVACKGCAHVFCDRLWGCRAVNGRSTLRPFGEWNLCELPPHVLGDSAIERDRLVAALGREGLSVEDLFRRCCAAAASGTTALAAPPAEPGAAGASAADTSSTVALLPDDCLCHACAQRVFAQRIFAWRADQIARERTAAPTAALPDCYYGKNCRTQRHNAAHAAKFNHVCEQTRA